MAKKKKTEAKKAPAKAEAPDEAELRRASMDGWEVCDCGETDLVNDRLGLAFSALLCVFLGIFAGYLGGHHDAAIGVPQHIEGAAADIYRWRGQHVRITPVQLVHEPEEDR